MFRHLITLLTIWLLSVEGASDTNYRLKTPIIPSSYSIIITPFFETGDSSAFRFDGEVSITITTQEPVSQIQLHSEDLVYNSTDITVTSNSINIALNESNPLQFVETYSFVYINLGTELQVNNEYILTIKYNGPIRDDLNGFYRNYYYENGTKKWLGATQLEPTSARKVFPCLDEPSYKAVFTLTIDRPATYKQSLTNTKLESTVTLPNGYVRETFYPTPKMSTYLVAFLVSEFEAAQYNTNGTDEFGLFTRPEARNQSDFAFDFGTRVVDALSNYFQIDYYSVDSNLKLDHVALIDFRAGAMENWGLIKYREALVLYVPEVSTPYYKYRVAQIVAHETTHMWFGNLVTCHWWSDTWLNEGFANYFQDYITSLIEPEIGSADMLVTGSVYEAYSADETINAPAITNEEVNSPAEISGHFGVISYQKAGSVIRMMHNLIGDDAFKYGLNAYLNANKFDVGIPDKMYSALHEGVLLNNALSAYPGITIAEVMSSWIAQAGHPVLQVDVDYDEEIITLNQKRFYIDSDHQSNETYIIPITYTTQSSPNFNNTKPSFILQEKQLELNVSGMFTDHDWIIVNIQETGFYRVNYDDHSWTIIANALKGEQREVIHHLNRAKIVNDLFAFVYADLVKFDILYEVLEFLTNETDYSVWYAALSGFNKLRSSYLGRDALAEIESYALKVIEPILENLGYEERDGDNFVTLRNRMQVLEFACKIGHQGCIDNAVELFKTLRENGTEISPSLRPVAYCIGLRNGDAEDFNFLWQRMSTTNVANEARIIGDALGCTDVEEKLREYLVSMLQEDSPIRTQDLTVPLTSTLADYNHVSIVLDALQQNYTVWSTIYPSIDSILSTVASALRTQSEFDEFESWLDNCSECTASSVTIAKTALALVKRSAEWAQEHESDILKTLRNDGVTTAPSLIILVLGLASSIIHIVKPMLFGIHL